MGNAVDVSIAITLRPLDPSPTEPKIMIAVAFNPKTLAPAWNALQSALPLRLATIHAQAEYMTRPTTFCQTLTPGRCFAF